VKKKNKKTLRSYSSKTKVGDPSLFLSGNPSVEVGGSRRKRPLEPPNTVLNKNSSMGWVAA
jgi:hypothetical protein